MSRPLADRVRPQTIEEVYELNGAILRGDEHELSKELGDVLLQVVFHARISEEDGDFTINEVINGVCEKLIHRHPHIFADVVADTSEEVLKNWEAIKKEEKGRKDISEVLSGVCTSLPALMRMQKLIKKSRQNSYEGGLVFPEGMTEDEKTVGRELFEICRKADSLSVDAEEVLEKISAEYVKSSKVGE